MFQLHISQVEARAQMSQLHSVRFFSQCLEATRSLYEDMELFNLFSEAFRNLPLAHLVDNKAPTGRGMIGVGSHPLENSEIVLVQ